MSRNIENASPNEVLIKEETFSRRDVLRGALVAGCSLFVPIALFSSSASGADAAPKMAKKNVQYQNQPKGASKCGGCMNFIAASKTCQRVEGSINPDGWCILWTKKA